jgi:hypothetical protein
MRAAFLVLGFALASPFLALRCSIPCETTGSCACASDADCDFGDNTTCRSRSCVAGACEQRAAETGTACSEVERGQCDPTGACVDLCATCSDGEYCDDATGCVAKKDQGADCAAEDECVTGQCVDDACCDSACDAVCSTCETGACALVGAALDPDEECAGVCDGQGLCADGEHAAYWTLPGQGTQVVRDVAVDDEGNVYVTGEFSETIDFGAGNVVNAGGSGEGYSEAFIAKYNAQGDLDWADTAGGFSVGMAIVVADGNAYAAGLFTGAIDLASTPFTADAGDVDLYLVKLDDGDGSLRWGYNYGDDYVDDVRLGVTSDGFLFVAGTYEGNLDFTRMGTPIASEGARDIFFAKLDVADASRKFQYAYPCSSIPSLEELAVEDNGRVGFTGSFMGNLEIASGEVLTAPGGVTAAFVAKFNQNGIPIYDYAFGGTGTTGATTLAFEPDGSAIVGGRFAGTATFVESMATSEGSNDAFLVGIDITGKEKWLKTFSGPEAGNATRVLREPSGNLLVAGTFSSTLSYDDQVLETNDNTSVYLLKLTPDRTFLWGRVIDSPDEEGLLAMRLLPDGKPLDLDGATLPAPGDLDGFIATRTP